MHWNINARVHWCTGAHMCNCCSFNRQKKIILFVNEHIYSNVQHKEEGAMNELEELNAREDQIHPGTNTLVQEMSLTCLVAAATKGESSTAMDLENVIFAN